MHIIGRQKSSTLQQSNSSSDPAKTTFGPKWRFNVIHVYTNWREY